MLVLSVLIPGCVQKQKTRAGEPSRIFGNVFDIIEKIYSSRSPDDKLLAAAQIRLSEVFT